MSVHCFHLPIVLESHICTGSTLCAFRVIQFVLPKKSTETVRPSSSVVLINLECFIFAFASLRRRCLKIFGKQPFCDILHKIDQPKAPRDSDAKPNLLIAFYTF